MPRPTIIHVNRNTIDSNRKQKTRKAPIIVRDGRRRQYGDRVEIRDAQGHLIAAFIHSPDKPLDCGARVWVEVYQPAYVVTKNGVYAARGVGRTLSRSACANH